MAIKLCAKEEENGMKTTFITIAIVLIVGAIAGAATWETQESEACDPQVADKAENRFLSCPGGNIGTCYAQAEGEAARCSSECGEGGGGVTGITLCVQMCINRWEFATSLCDATCIH